MRKLTKNGLSWDEDWYGNNAAVTCPVCRQVFLVSGFISKGRRECPRCQKSSAEITEEQVKLEWPEELVGSTALLRAMQGTAEAVAGQQAAGSPRICIFGTHHAYQYKTVRRRYFQNVHDLIMIHAADLVAEEFSAHGQTSYAEKIAGLHGVLWKNVDLTGDERKHVPDLNPYSIGTQIDGDLQSLREWVWVARTAKAMKRSALLICGFAHTTGIAEKFGLAGFEVEIHVYFDNADDRLITHRTEEESVEGATRA
jgi:hypothetical protein